MKHVWLVNLFFGPGAAPTGVLLASLADELLRHGWRVDVLTGTAEYRADFASTDAEFAGKIHYFRCASSGKNLRSKLRTWLTFYWKLAWFLLWHRLPDLVIVQTTPPFLHTLFALRALFSWRRSQIILWNQDTYPESLVGTGMLKPTSLIYRGLQWVARWSARRIEHAVVLDGAMGERLRQQGARWVTLIPNWDLAPPAVAGVGLPHELEEIAAGYRYRIAYTGNLGRGHDLSPLWSYLQKHPAQTDFCIVFVGEGDRTAELRGLVEREGWTCVKFWPYLPAAEFAALLHWADFGLVALEPSCLGLMSPSKMHAWLATGKPVIYIGPAGSNVSETLDAFSCGFVVDPAQPDSFQQVAATLTTDEVLPRMHVQSRVAWRTRHSPEVGLKAWWDLLNRVHDSGTGSV